jgi:hypothetical protein
VNRADAYAALSAELERCRALPQSDLVALVDAAPVATIVPVDGELLSVEVTVRWIDPRRTSLRVEAIARGSSHWKLERLEEAITLSATDGSVG